MRNPIRWPGHKEDSETMTQDELSVSEKAFNLFTSLTVIAGCIVLTLFLIALGVNLVAWIFSGVATIYSVLGVSGPGGLKG